MSWRKELLSSKFMLGLSLASPRVFLNLMLDRESTSPMGSMLLIKHCQQPRPGPAETMQSKDRIGASMLQPCPGFGNLES